MKGKAKPERVKARGQRVLSKTRGKVALDDNRDEPIDQKKTSISPSSWGKREKSCTGAAFFMGCHVVLNLCHYYGWKEVIVSYRISQMKNMYVKNSRANCNFFLVTVLQNCEIEESFAFGAFLCPVCHVGVNLTCSYVNNFANVWIIREQNVIFPARALRNCEIL